MYAVSSKSFIIVKISVGQKGEIEYKEKTNRCVSTRQHVKPSADQQRFTFIIS